MEFKYESLSAMHRVLYQILLEFSPLFAQEWTACMLLFSAVSGVLSVQGNHLCRRRS